MRLQGRLTAVGFVLAFGTIQTAAETPNGARGIEALNAIVPPLAGHRACFARTYDSQHLAEHPRQRVIAMLFELRYARVPDIDMERYEFSISARLRGRAAPLYASGVCETHLDEAYPAGNLLRGGV